MYSIVVTDENYNSHIYYLTLKTQDIRTLYQIGVDINSFFNTRGGTLNIGVNNSGYGVGVEEDLNTSFYYGDKDKYIRSIVDAVALELGNSIATT